jgi:hypothetical protein
MATYASGNIAPWMADPLNRGLRGDTVAVDAMADFKRQLAERGVIPGAPMPYAKTGNRRVGSGLRVPTGTVTEAPPVVYAETGDPQFKSGLAVPQAPPEAPDPARQAALAALALQQIQSSPLAAASGFNAPTSLGDAFAQAVKAGQTAAQPPSTILGAPSYTNVGGPIPLARRIG